jgi:hypothetical protein
VPHSIPDLFSENVHELGRALFNFYSSDLAPNAGGEPRPIAGATQERKLLGVGSTAWFGVVWARNTNFGLDLRPL